MWGKQWLGFHDCLFSLQAGQEKSKICWIACFQVNFSDSFHKIQHQKCENNNVFWHILNMFSHVKRLQFVWKCCNIEDFAEIYEWHEFFWKMAAFKHCWQWIVTLSVTRTMLHTHGMQVPGLLFNQHCLLFNQHCLLFFVVPFNLKIFALYFLQLCCQLSQWNYLCFHDSGHL